MLSYVFQYKFTILLLAFIALLSLVPGENMPGSFLFSIPHIDKIIHMSMYAALGFVALAENRRDQSRLGMHVLLLLFFFALSAMIEILQATVVAARSAEWFDLLANFLGLIGGYIAHRLIGGWRIFRFLRS
ncbi:MAG: VanZ family protein [Anaerolineales bacterium]|jgi:VanZ family protein|nr:VanZ family protein [Anaerolineales bacterium]